MRDYYRKKLNRLLSFVDDEGFVQLLWATHILQSENPEPAHRYILPETIPNGSISAKIPSEYAIHEWEIETLANELMTVPKIETKNNGPIRKLRWDHLGAMIECVNWLRKLENSEYRIKKKREDVFIEMGRIAARQFGWQRGFVNISQFYRNAFVYGQGPCAAQFEVAHGITLNRFSQIGFMLFVSLNNFPIVRNDSSWVKMGVEWQEVERVLALIAMPFPKAAALARSRRRKTIHTADKPSILRQFPCLRFGEQCERIRAPLPELILERVTSGVFYDVVDGGGPIRDDYGRRFEDYCARYFAETLPGFEWEREFNYRKKPNTLPTVDILCKESDEISIAFECKATRMSQQAMFGINPIEDRGYQDIKKAVFQLWRFFSHCRRGFVGRAVKNDAVGVVLTLDNWLVMAETLRKQVLADAEKMALQKDPEISEEDRKPIVFVAIPELERTLSASTEGSFLQALKLSNTEKFSGWRLDGVHSDLLGGTVPSKRGFPFADDLGQLLPWWDEWNEQRKKR